MNDCVAVILAAGKGTRMKSRLPKVLHPLAGLPMVAHVVEAVRAIGASRIVLVVGHEGGLVREAMGGELDYVDQVSQLGTGHAVLQAHSLLQGWSGDMLVLCGDTPLATSQTLGRLLRRHRDSGAPITMLTASEGHRQGAGRVVRDASGNVKGIVEESEAAAGQRDIAEWNAGIYCFRVPWVWAYLTDLPVHSSGEYYLTDVVEMAVLREERVEAVASPDPGECLGINSRVELALAESALRQRIRDRLMSEGVTLVDPRSVFIDHSVEVGADTVLYPNTHLLGKSRIGRECRLGPNTIISDSVIGDGCEVLSSVVEGATLEDHIDVGPFSHVRPEAYLEAGVHVGNYVELKASRLGRGTKIGHFSYVGDAQVGRDVNIGAGTVTANYDGKAKHQTVIEDGVFIGSDSTLVAPVRIGSGAVTGAGSVVTRDVPPGAVVYGIPARVRTEGE